MFKLFHKKLNKKGFTLAELLVVIAILAILIAIAVPVFTAMVADAQLRVNQANIRSVKAAAVAKILTNLHEKDDTEGEDIKYNKGTVKDGGWVAVARVNNAGTVSDLKVFTCAAGGEHSTQTSWKVDFWAEGILTGDGGSEPMLPKKTAGALPASLGDCVDKNEAAEENSHFYKSTGAETTADALAGIKPTSGSTQGNQVSYYVVQVVIKDIDVNAKPE